MHEAGKITIIAVILLSVFFLVTVSAHTGPNNETSGTGEFHSGRNMPCMGLSPDEMDKDGDGLCDYCGMPVEQCGEMAVMHESMHSGDFTDMHHGMMHSMMETAEHGCH